MIVEKALLWLVVAFAIVLFVTSPRGMLGGINGLFSTIAGFFGGTIERTADFIQGLGGSG